MFWAWCAGAPVPRASWVTLLNRWTHCCPDDARNVFSASGARTGPGGSNVMSRSKLSLLYGQPEIGGDAFDLGERKGR